jgi:hypothetical protein
MAAAVLACVTAAHAAPAIDSNTVTLSFAGISISDIQFDGTIEVTPGQAFSSPPTIKQTGGSGNETVWTITLLANRQNNSDVATDFNNDTGGINLEHQFSPKKQTAPDFPSELNFFFGINLFEQGDSSSIATVDLGQGNTGFPSFLNNWWIGSPNLINFSNSVNQGSAQLTLNDGSQISINGGVSNFNFVRGNLGAIPEPATWVLMAVGFLGFALVGRCLAGSQARSV